MRETVLTPPIARGLPDGCQYIPIAHCDIDTRGGADGVCTVLIIGWWGESSCRYYVPTGKRKEFRVALRRFGAVKGRWPMYEITASL